MSSPLEEVRVGTQGRIVLPRAVRDALGAEEGAVYVATVEGDRLILEPRAAVLRRMRARLRGAAGESLVDELIAERRAEAAAERQR